MVEECPLPRQGTGLTAAVKVEMVGQPPRDADPETRISEEHERARALAEVLRDQEERMESLRLAEERRGRRARWRRGVVAVCWVTVAYVWLGSPSWLRVEAPPQPTILEEARSLRLNVFLQSQRIEAYRQDRGRLPYVLEEAGPPFPGMEYRRKDNRFYELRGASDRVRLRYESEQPAFDFVGPAADVLAEVPADQGDDR